MLLSGWEHTGACDGSESLVGAVKHIQQSVVRNSPGRRRAWEYDLLFGSWYESELV